MFENTYWANNGKHESAAKQLSKLIPIEGSVDKPRSTNKKLEKFRKACNCYHDLYNNGLRNRAQEFRQVFGFASSPLKRYGRFGSFQPSLYEKTEEVMDEIVLAAAKEQGIIYTVEEVTA
jgi:hypothetical protein